MGETEVAAAWEEGVAKTRLAIAAWREAEGFARESDAADRLAEITETLIEAGGRLAELVRSAYEPGTWTVLGVWDNDEAVPVGAIEGRHNVHGDPPGERAAAQALREGNPEFYGFDTSSFYEQGAWATSVTAPDGDTAQDLAAAEMMEGEEE